MINGNDEIALGYLLDPAFQLVNTSGKPLTDGYIEVYYHGTRDKYYCYSDWNGTLHPFKIPLDSLGSNIVLADPNFSYDIYVYNKYGTLQMSRYNVNPGSGSGGGSSGEGGPAEHWSSDIAGGASTTVTGGTTVYLTLPSSEDQPDFVDHSTETAIFLKEGLYHIDAVVSFKQDEDDLENIIKDLVVNTGLTGWDAQMTGQKNWTGPESTDDDRHFLELHTVVSVPEDQTQTLYFQISSPVDLDSAAIEKLDIVKLEASGGGVHYAAGYGIDITGQIISTSGMMPEASAANFVDVNSYQVDIQNIYETIAETSAMIPSGVATEQYVQDYTSAFITEDALNGYATEQWVVDQGYITSADLPQSVPLVAGDGISIVDTSASTIISCSGGGVTKEWVENYTSAFVTANVLDDYVTVNHLNEVVSGLSDDISAVSAAIPSLDGYATEQFVEDYTSAFITSADIPDIPEDVVTSGELATVSGDIVSQIPSLDGYATQQWVGEQGYLTSIPEDLVTSAELASTSATLESMIPSLDGYATEQFVEDYTSAFITSADIPDVPEDVVTSGELATVSAQIENDIPDVSDMATKTWVGDQGYLTSIPDEYATSGDLVTLSAAIENDIPSYTAGDNISIVNDVISVDETAGLIAGENINITASGENYVISSTGGEVPADVVTSGELATVSASLSRVSTYASVGGFYPLPVETNHKSLRFNYGTGILSPSANVQRLVEVGNGSTYTSLGELVPVPPTSGLVLTSLNGNLMSWKEASGGLDQVYHDAGLTGSGTSASPLSITSAANWTQAYDAINASAASWNDAAAIVEYPISAGPGMNIEDVSGVTVFGPDVPYLTQAIGADETVIYNGKLPNLNSNLTLTESWNNFKQIRVRGGDNTPEDHYYSSVSPSKAAFKISWAYNWMFSAYLKFSATNDPKVWTYAANTYIHYTHTDTSVSVTQNDTTTLGSGCNFKVVGIGRISGGN